MPTQNQSRPLTTSYSRTRSRGSFGKAIKITETAVAGPAGGESWTQDRGYASPTGEVEVMSDVVQSAFQRRRAAGEVVFNPMESMRFSMSGTGNGMKVRRVKADRSYGQTYELSGNFPIFQVLGNQLSTITAPADRLPVVDQGGLNRAVAEAITKARRFPTEANYLVTLAEFRQALGMVPSLWKDWTRLFAQLNKPVHTPRKPPKGYDPALKRLLQDIGSIERTAINTWLIMRFGVRPLISDTLALMKMLNKAYDVDPVRLTSRGSSLFSKGWDASFESAYGITTTCYTQSYTENIHVRAMQLWECKLDFARDAGFSIASIPEAAIDLVRFSFVVNWMVNLNDFFSATGSLVDPGVTSRGGCYVVTEEQSSVWQPTGTRITDASPDWQVVNQVGGHVAMSKTRKRRIVGLPLPQLVVRAEPLKFLTDPRLVDAVALLGQQLRGRNVSILSRLSAQYGAF